MAANFSKFLPANLTDSAVLLTGGTGSFGRRMVRTLLRDHAPRRLVVFSRDETKQYDMAREFPSSAHPNLHFVLGDVRDSHRLECAMAGIDIVVHAAALKHVPTAEQNPFECILTNVMGAENLVRAAIRCNVQWVLALSTDKAVKPVNLYGASKLAADKIFLAADARAAAGGPRFSIVRYGNVLGSRGGVVELFRRLIKEGADSLPITDERMTRFWITLDEAVAFVLSSLGRMRGGEIFVPKIPSMRVVDLARAVGPGLSLRPVGIRPGEKLHEVLIAEDDAEHTVDCGDSYMIVSRLRPGIPPGPSTLPGQTYVREGFCYASDSNAIWLDGAELKELLDLS